MGVLNDALVIMPSYGLPERDTQRLVSDLVAEGATLLEAHGLGLIDRVRSELASQALETTEHPWWIWIDADMSAPWQEIERLLLVAQRHDADLMHAPYVTKERPAMLACALDHKSPLWPTENRREIVLGRDGYLYPLRRCGFGATVTKRSLFERVKETLPRVRFRQSKDGRPYFLPLILEQEEEYLGEDYSFCERAYRLPEGARMWADTRIRVGHVGKYRYMLEDSAERTLSPTVILEVG